MIKYPAYLKSKYTKSSQEEALFMIAGVLSRIILTKDYFGANPDLKDFTKIVMGQDYRDYLFANRNALYSRALRDIIRMKDNDKQLEVINNILKFINDFQVTDVAIDNSKSKETKKNNVSNIKSWSELINPKD